MFIKGALIERSELKSPGIDKRSMSSPSPLTIDAGDCEFSLCKYGNSEKSEVSGD